MLFELLFALQPNALPALATPLAQSNQAEPTLRSLAPPSAGSGALQHRAIEGRVLVKLSPNADFDPALWLTERGLPAGAQPAFLPTPAGRVDRVGLDRILKLEVPVGRELEALELLELRSDLEWIERDFSGPALAAGGLIPNDPLFGLQWQLQQPSDIDMDVPEAWALRGTTQADSNLVVAVIDTGFGTGPGAVDLTGMLWSNPGELPNGLDDDGNGLIDDISGYDFVRDDAIADDEHGHGIACTGIIAANTDNAQDLAGIANGVKILPIKVFGPTGDFPTSGPYAGHLSAAAGLQYAANQGADLVSNSWGVFTGFSAVVNDAVLYAQDQGTRLIFAGGNFGQTFFFPSDMEGLIAVAAIDPAGQRCIWGFGSSSNYGPWVDLAAGGTSIVSPYLGFVTSGFNGTSAACPQVAGVAALVLSENDDLTLEDLRQVLMSTAVNIDALNPGFEGLLGAGHVNALAALEAVQPFGDVGAGLPGGSAPVLNAWGGTGGDTQLTIAASGAEPGAPGLLIIGNAQVDLPLFGGTLIPSTEVQIPLTADAIGRASVTLTLPASVPSGLTRYLQAGFVDVGAPESIALTAGLEYTAP